MPRKINYSEGDCFAIPLRHGGVARGVVARMNGKGIVFGYFFGPKIDCEDNAIVDDSIYPGAEILSGQFGDLGLLENEWKIIGTIQDWDRHAWKMPVFLRWEEGNENGVLCTYDEDSLKTVSEEPVRLSTLDSKKIPRDRLMGYGSVEIKLTKLLNSLGRGDEIGDSGD